jgi:hypothetical protein
MQHSAVQSEPKTHSFDDAWPSIHQGDPHWELTLRVISGRQFARSPLLSKFLLFVVAEALEGRAGEITEHQIGVRVFNRPPNYRTIEDNIVRNYARQLRKRLADHFCEEGRGEAIRIDIPVGGYAPVFLSAGEAAGRNDTAATPELAAVSAPHLQLAEPALPAATKAGRWIPALMFLAAYSGLLIGATWYLARREPMPQQSRDPAQALWSAMFSGPANSFIVPSDAGFNLIEDISRQPVPLADYIAGNYERLPLSGVDAHSAQDLRSQQLTPFVDLQIASAFARLSQNDPERVSIRFPRDLTLDDLKNANAVIIGSVGSNPWAAVAEANANFRITDRPGMSGAEIVNLHPEPGEADNYASHWNEPAHETFALIEFRPNLSGNGHLLVLEGLDVAGTQASAEMLLDPSQIDPILRRAVRADGSIRSFEILLRSTSIESNATSTQVVASRIYQGPSPTSGERAITEHDGAAQASRSQ